MEDQPLPFHVGVDSSSSSFSTPRAGSRYHRHQRSSSFNSPGRPKSRERTAVAAAPVSTKDVLISKSVTASEQGVNFNRWSKSTSSSVTSNTHKRSSSFTRRMSFGGGAFLDTTPSPPRKLQKNRPSTGTSPSQPRITRSAFDSSLILPPINTLPSLQTSVGSNSSPLTGATTPSPSTAQILSAAARSVDYFGRAWEDSTSGPKDFAQKRSVPLTRTAILEPSPVLGPENTRDGGVSNQAVEEERSRSRGHSRNRSQVTKGSSGTGSSGRSSKQPSQKAMLSKALQKANTAVLLDNAQNFEGAMQAYSEACSLLQQVMLRSSGDDDRRKLEAIVGFVGPCNTYSITNVASATPILAG